MFAWPFRQIHLEGVKDRIEYAQLLNDASEVKIRDYRAGMVHGSLGEEVPEKTVTLIVPVRQPDFEVPVIEIFLKD